MTMIHQLIKRLQCSSSLVQRTSRQSRRKLKWNAKSHFCYSNNDYRQHHDLVNPPFGMKKNIITSCCNRNANFSSSSTAVATTATDDLSSSITEKVKENYLLTYYQEELINKGNVIFDEHQIKALTELDRLRDDLLSTNSQEETTTKGSNDPSCIGDGEEQEISARITSQTADVPSSSSSSFGSFLTGLFSSSNQNDDSKSINVLTMEDSTKNIVKGVYLHGGVGCGKTFCMDLFYDSLPGNDDNDDEKVPRPSKQKVHFHKFMLDVHKQMHEAKMVEGVEGDVLPRVIERTMERGRIICFDEFQVTDVADALILRRLFTGLLDRGAVIVATSNRPPQDLYLNGIQRDLFLPFIDLLEERTSVISMWDSETDYRLVHGENKAEGVYFIGEESKSKFNRVYLKLTKNSLTSPTSLKTDQGRLVPIPDASIEYGVARFSFDDLCREARGAADYLVIGANFHTVFIEDIPNLSMNDVNLVRRFIVFVDSMYENHVKLIVHAASSPDEIFKVDLSNQHCDEAFAFDRTRSRLEEMGSDEYLKSRWIGSSSKTK